MYQKLITPSKNVYLSYKKDQFERLAITKQEINNLLLYIGVSIANKRDILSSTKIDIKWLEKELRKALISINKIANKVYVFEPEKKYKPGDQYKLILLNDDLLNKEEVHYLTSSVERAYKYIIYSKWFDQNMKLCFDWGEN